MKYSHHRRAIAAVLLVACCSLLPALWQPPIAAAADGPHQLDQQHATSTARTQRASTSTRKPCVLLRNGHVMYGTAVQQGDWVVIQSNGQESRLPHHSVACWGDSLGDLYQFKLDHRRSGDVAVHLRDAQWCMRQELWDLAAVEVNLAERLSPNSIHVHRAQQQLERLVQSRRELATTVRVASGESATDSDGQHTGDVAMASFEEDASDAGPVDRQTLQAFAQHVQPLLANRCGTCHSHTTDQTWTLVLPNAGARPSARMTRENLLASLVFIDFDAPENSPLLLKAVTPHGGENAPLSPHDDHARDTLKAWLEIASVEPSSDGPNSRGLNRNGDPQQQVQQMQGVANPRWAALMQERRLQQVTAGNVEAALSPLPSGPLSSDPLPAGDSSQGSSPQGSSAPSTETSPPARLPKVKNPFDPAIFNRRYHRD